MPSDTLKEISAGMRLPVLFTLKEPAKTGEVEIIGGKSFTISNNMGDKWWAESPWGERKLFCLFSLTTKDIGILKQAVELVDRTMQPET